MPTSQEQRIFKNASTTFFAASTLFPRGVRDDVFTLYAFVRTADDFIDQVEPDRQGFEAFTDELWAAHLRGTSDDPIISRFVDLWKLRSFERSWVDAFLRSMESDLDGMHCATLKETEHYMYGSAEVIGLMMARVLDLPDKSLPYAQKLGKAFQYLNMIRDVAEDLELGRQYLPQAELERYGLTSLAEDEVREDEGAFRLFMQAQLARYEKWQRQAEVGFSYMSKRQRVPVTAASRISSWTAERIKENPLVVYEQKVKPSRLVIVREVARSLV